MKLLLASQSPYRKELLQKLGYPFLTAKPLVDEEALKDPKLSPLALAQFLAFKKAESLASTESIVIGSDQLIHLEGKILGKPHTMDNAFKQLQAMSGKTHELITAVSVLYYSAGKMQKIEFTNTAKIIMRKLADSEIKNYVDLEKPLDCAGSYKIEAAGMRLMERVECSDWTSIQGLPLLELHQNLLKIFKDHPLKDHK